MALIALPPLAQAQADEGVYVLPAGGVSSLPTVIVRSPAGGPPRLERGTPRQLTLADGGLATYSDVVALPDGDLLLGDGSGRGGVLFDEQGDQRDAYFPDADLAAPSSLVVAGFATPDTPDLLLMGDDSVGRALIYDVIDQSYTWHYTLTHNGVRGQIARAVALPQQRFAIAVNWPALSLSAVKIVAWESSAQPELALYSEAVDEDTPVLAGLYPVRDLAADLDGRMLVTSRDQIAIIDEAGQLLWELHMGDDPALGGQFQSARWLDSGLIVAATRQPGLWIEPHTNHRLHLIDPSPDVEVPLLDSSDNFEAAPLRIEPWSGTAPTGTRDFYADAYDFDGASPADLSLEDDRPSLVPRQIHLDETTFFGFALHNDTDGAITMRRADFLVAHGACDDLELPEALHQPWWSDGSLTRIEAGQSHQISQQVLLAEPLGIGLWCGQLRLTGRDGSRHFLGTPLDFEILPPFGQDSPVSVDVLLEFGDAGLPADHGSDGDEMGTGCACSTGGGSQAPLFILVLLAGLILYRRGRPALPSGPCEAPRGPLPLRRPPGTRRAR